jgi:predicted metal-dependent enzyme (double-stranded beta helix superfamily)
MDFPDLIRSLDAAVDAADDATRCSAVADALKDAIRDGGSFLSPSVCEPIEGHYGRRLLHRDPAGRYTMIAMIWGAGQGTALHDHAGIWCVEAVYQGNVRVTSFARTADKDSCNGVYDFRKEDEIVTGVGDAGALIPPYEYHVLENAGEPTAVTIHVYGGEMEVCRIFEPLAGGGWQRVEKSLAYDG